MGVFPAVVLLAMLADARFLQGVSRRILMEEELPLLIPSAIFSLCVAILLCFPSVVLSCLCSQDKVVMWRVRRRKM